MKESDIIDLFDLMLEQLRDLYDGVNIKLRFLSKADEMADSEELDEMILAHKKQSHNQLERLEMVFSKLAVDPTGEECAGLKALTKESLKVAKRCKIPEVRDASLITSIQHIHHYEMAGYGTAIAYAKVLKRHDLAEILLNNLREDKDADNSLSDLAIKEINLSATWDTLISNLQEDLNS